VQSQVKVIPVVGPVLDHSGRPTESEPRVHEDALCDSADEAVDEVLCKRPIDLP
jgi:hypothetical protein